MSDEIMMEAREHELAEVASVEPTGLKLIFDGESESDGKTYKCNSAVKFATGDRVRVEKLANTYVISYPIGDPSCAYPIPTGGTNGQYLVKDGSQPYALKWQTLSVSGTLPAGGTTDQYLAKNTDTDYDCKWMTLEGTLPAGGSTGQILRKKSSTKYDVEWAALNGLLPTGGTTGQILQKSSYSDYAVSWITPPVTGTSATIGFMGTTAAAKKTVAKLASSATLASAVSKVNDILTALAGYGLIYSY